MLTGVAGSGEGGACHVRVVPVRQGVIQKFSSSSVEKGSSGSRLRFLVIENVALAMSVCTKRQVVHVENGYLAS